MPEEEYRARGSRDNFQTPPTKDEDIILLMTSGNMPCLTSRRVGCVKQSHCSDHATIPAAENG